MPAPNGAVFPVVTSPHIAFYRKSRRIDSLLAASQSLKQPEMPRNSQKMNPLNFAFRSPHLNPGFGSKVPGGLPPPGVRPKQGA